MLEDKGGKREIFKEERSGDEGGIKRQRQGERQVEKKRE